MNNAGRIGFVLRGDYDNTATYDFLDVVYFGNSSYVARKLTIGNEPENDNEYWLALAKIPDNIVTGIKGANEAEFRNGNVTLTPENIGALPKDGTAAAASRLDSTSSIDGVEFNGSKAITHYTTCTTAASETIKKVSLPNLSLIKGSRITIYFSYKNTTANPSLNVNSTGAKTIHYNGSALTSENAGILKGCCEFVFNGTYWYLIGTHTMVKGDSESSYRQDLVNLTKENIGLGNVGNYKAVSTTASQGLSNTEKANARANIGAGTSSFSGNYNDLSNKPSIPTAVRVKGNAESTYRTGDVNLTPANIGAFPSSGGTISGDVTITKNLRLKGSGNFGNKLNFGDGDYAYISEPADDNLEMKAKNINLVTADNSAAEGYGCLKWNGIAMEEKILNMVYPIGSIYMSVNNISPQTFLGGTWVAWGAGKVPVGVNTSDSNFNASEKTGGSKTTTITQENLPNLKLEVVIPGSLGGTKHKLYGDHNDAAGATGTGAIPNVTTNSTHSNPAYVSTGGSNTSLSLLQPYITCYMWKRTA